MCFIFVFLLVLFIVIVYFAYAGVELICYRIEFYLWDENPEALHRYYHWLELAPTVAAVLTVIALIVLFFILINWAGKKDNERKKLLNEEKKQLQLSRSYNLTTYEGSGSTYRIIFDDKKRVFHYLYFKDPYADVLEPRRVAIPYANLSGCLDIVTTH